MKLNEGASIQRVDTLVQSEPGIEIFVRKVRSGQASGHVPVLLVHGGGPPGLASFDLPVAGYSLAADLAAMGHPVSVMDVRGWGRSTRPRELEQPPDRNPPAVRVDEVARDIAAVVDEMQQDGDGPVALLGWASGGHWAAFYATHHPENVSHLVLLNTLYGLSAPWELREQFEAPGRRNEFDGALGAYSLRTASSLLAGWDDSIPTDDKSAWRDPVVGDAYVAEAMASDPLSESHEPPAIRVPRGFQREAFEMSMGRRYWEASEILAPTLVVRGQLDFWSRPEDAEVLRTEINQAGVARLVTILGGTHYLLNDRPEHGRTDFLREVVAFLGDGPL